MRKSEEPKPIIILADNTSSRELMLEGIIESGYEVIQVTEAAKLEAVTNKDACVLLIRLNANEDFKYSKKKLAELKEQGFGGLSIVYTLKVNAELRFIKSGVDADCCLPLRGKPSADNINKAIKHAAAQKGGR